MWLQCSEIYNTAASHVSLSMSCNQTSIRIMNLKTIWVSFCRFFFLSLLNCSKPYSPRLKKSTQHHGTWNFNTGTDKVSFCINNIYCKYYKYITFTSKWVTWCFTPSQPLWLYQGNHIHKHTTFLSILYTLYIGGNSFSSSKYQKSFNIPNIQQRLFSTSWLG